MDWNSMARSRGRRPKRIFWPSRGPIGMRLKMAMPRLVMMRGMSKRLNGEGRILRRIAQATASKMLLVGPAIEMRAMSLLGFSRL